MDRVHKRLNLFSVYSLLPRPLRLLPELLREGEGLLPELEGVKLRDCEGVKLRDCEGVEKLRDGAVEPLRLIDDPLELGVVKLRVRGEVIVERSWVP